MDFVLNLQTFVGTAEVAQESHRLGTVRAKFRFREFARFLLKWQGQVQFPGFTTFFYKKAHEE
jgi:hypothetical protein